MCSSDLYATTEIYTLSLHDALPIRAPIVTGADFGHVARGGSEEASACEGGHLGYFPRGRRVPQFEAAAFAPAPGAISHSHNRIERIDDD